jgi:hypothetical protein
MTDHTERRSKNPTTGSSRWIHAPSATVGGIIALARLVEQAGFRNWSATGD